MRNILIWATTLAALGPTTEAWGSEPSLDTLAEQVSRLRGEIEALDAKLQEQRESRRAQLRTLSTRRGAVELELQREELRARQLAERAARAEERARTSEARREHLARATLTAIGLLRPTLDVGVPFQTEQRRSAFEALLRALEARGVDPSAAIAQAWEWIDGELDLRRKSELSQQAVTLDGQVVLADVARIGLIALYFRTPDGRYGLARRHGDEWRWEVLAAPEDGQRLAALFSALEGGETRGLFVLPGAVTQEMLGVAR